MSFVVCLLVSFLCGCLPLMVVCLIMHPFSFAYIPHTPILIHKQYRLFSFTNSTYSSSHSQTTQTLTFIHKQHRLSLSFTNNTYSYFHSLTAQTLTFIHKQHILFFSFTDSTYSSSHSQTAHTLTFIHKQHIISLSFTNNTYSYFHSLTTRTLHFCRQSQSTLTLPSNQHTHSIAINTHSITTHTTTIPKRERSRKQTPIPAIGVSSSEKRQNND